MTEIRSGCVREHYHTRVRQAKLFEEGVVVSEHDILDGAVCEQALSSAIVVQVNVLQVLAGKS